MAFGFIFSFNAEVAISNWLDEENRKEKTLCNKMRDTCGKRKKAKEGEGHMLTE